MKRIDFIKNLLGTGLLLTLPSLSKGATASPDNNTISFREFELPQENLAASQTLSTASIPIQYSQVEVYKTYLAGFRYYSGVALIKRINVGDTLDLVREPNNTYDENAIAVYWEAEKLGFLPMADNLVLKNMIDGGVPLYATVAKTNPDAEPWRMLKVSVGMLYPTAQILHRATV